MSVYHHSPLLQPDSSIRLLQLLPRREDPKNLRCKIFECALRNSDKATRPYEALSYVWGSEHKPQSIIVVNEQKKTQNDNQEDNQKLAVTQNLYEMLSQLEDDDIPRTIWVDAVCIDQSNTQEKELQIPLMAEIYAKASRVIVWLGGARDDSDEALKSIRIAAENSANIAKTQLVERAIQALLERPWFRRIWVREQDLYLLMKIN